MLQMWWKCNKIIIYILQGSHRTCKSGRMLNKIHGLENSGNLKISWFLSGKNQGISKWRKIAKKNQGNCTYMYEHCNCICFVQYNVWSFVLACLWLSVHYLMKCWERGFKSFKCRRYSEEYFLHRLLQSPPLYDEILQGKHD